MREITIDGDRMTDPEHTIIYLKEVFEIEYSGDNLDALWDILSSRETAYHVVFVNEEAAYKNLGSYAERVIRLFNQLNMHRDNFSFEITN